MRPDKFEFVSNALLAEVMNVSNLSVPSCCLCLLLLLVLRCAWFPLGRARAFSFPQFFYVFTLERIIDKKEQIY